jgi:hypothetical protein
MPTFWRKVLDPSSGLRYVGRRTGIKDGYLDPQVGKGDGGDGGGWGGEESNIEPLSCSSFLLAQNGLHLFSPANGTG